MSFKSPLRLVPSIRARMDAVLGGPSATYADKVLSYNPFAYWPLWETVGVTAVDQVDSPAQDGTYTGVTLANILGPDGVNSAPLFDGINDLVDVYSVPFRNAFAATTDRSIMCWARVFNVGVWSDGTVRQVWRFRSTAGGGGWTYARRTAPNTNIEHTYNGSGVTDTETEPLISTTEWMHLVATISETSDLIVFYINSAVVDTDVGVGAWAGVNIDVDKACLGAEDTTTPSEMWYGWLAQCAVFDYALAPGDVIDLFTV